VTTQSKRRAWVFGVVGYFIGFAVALALSLLVTTTFEVGLALGAGLTLIGYTSGYVLGWRTR
jgi:4-hydroxybenzoate polyprenyltransferase